MKLRNITSLLPDDLLTFANELQVTVVDTMCERDIIFAIVEKLHTEMSEPVYGEGVLDVLPEDFGFGFLRAPGLNYLAGPFDIYISPTQIRKFKLYTGCVIEGKIRSPIKSERFLAMLQINSINSEDAATAFNRIGNEKLFPVYPRTGTIG